MSRGWSGVVPWECGRCSVIQTGRFEIACQWEGVSYDDDDDDYYDHDGDVERVRTGHDFDRSLVFSRHSRCCC